MRWVRRCLKGVAAAAAVSAAGVFCVWGGVEEFFLGAPKNLGCPKGKARVGACVKEERRC
jgi:hypothetical protein